MRRRAWIWLFGIFFAIVVLPIGFFRYGDYQEEQAFQEQLRLARAEGIPTNAAEFAATIKPARPEENAAPLYTSLYTKKLTTYKDDPMAVARRVDFQPTAENLRTAKDLLTKRKEALDIADQAVLLLRCWFDRDWRLGLAVLFPEYATMNATIRLMLLRGSLAAHGGDSKSALEEVRKSLVIARHAADEGHLLSSLVGDGARNRVLAALANWAFVYSDRPEYRKALLDTIAAMPRPDVRAENRGLLFEVLSAIELCATKEGREMLGLKPEDIGSADQIFPILFDPGKSRIKLVEAQREFYAALALPPKQRLVPLENASMKFNEASLAFPVAAKVYFSLSADSVSPQANRELLWEARRLEYVAFARALGGKATPKTIETKDLLSPFDGKPVTYKFDGKQIVITVSGSDTNGLKIPPNAILGR